jgi:hypothetical protein
MAAASLNLFSESVLKAVLYSLMMASSVFSLRTLMSAARDNKGHDAVPRSDEDERVSFDSHFRGNNSSPLDSPIPLASVSGSKSKERKQGAKGRERFKLTPCNSGGE